MKKFYVPELTGGTNNLVHVVITVGMPRVKEYDRLVQPRSSRRCSFMGRYPGNRHNRYGRQENLRANPALKRGVGRHLRAG